MSKRLLLRVLATLAAFVAVVAGSARAALAVRLPDPGIQPAVLDPIGGTPIPIPSSMPVVQAPSTSVVILGMNWQLALAAALFVLAAGLFVAAAVQRRHVAHA